METMSNFGDYILGELESHMDYYKKLAKKQDEIDLEIEKLTKEIIRASDEGEEISRENFVSVETLRRVYSVVITEFVKTSSRIAMLFQVIASFGLVKDIEQRKDYGLIKRIVEEFEFMFISDKGNFDLVNPDVKSIIEKAAESQVPKEGLKEMASLLKKQYEEFLVRNPHAKKADDK